MTGRESGVVHNVELECSVKYYLTPRLDAGVKEDSLATFVILNRTEEKVDKRAFAGSTYCGVSHVLR